MSKHQRHTYCCSQFQGHWFETKRNMGLGGRTIVNGVIIRTTYSPTSRIPHQKLTDLTYTAPETHRPHVYRTRKSRHHVYAPENHDITYTAPENHRPHVYRTRKSPTSRIPHQQQCVHGLILVSVFLF